MKKILYTIITVSSSLLLFNCEPDNPVEPPPVVSTCTPINNPDATSYVEVTYPSAGDTLTVGQNITIKFKFQATQKLSSGINAMAMLNVGKQRFTITSPSAIVFQATGTFTCAEIPWTVGFGNITPSDENPVSATLKIYEYDDGDYFHISKPFFIKK